MLAIIPNRKIFLTASAVLVLLSAASLAVWGLKFGIDFTGGSLWEVEFPHGRPDSAAILAALVDYKMDTALIQPVGEKGVILRSRDINENTHQAALIELKGLGAVEEKRFESIGPTLGKELQRKSVKAVIGVLVLIIVYIAWAFRKVARPVSSWKYGVIAIIALIHDVTIPTGVFAVLGHFGGVEVDALFVTAALTILGFSVHDTIVVFDRIRENLKRRSGEDFSQTVNASVNETMSRSISTSLTVLLVLAAIYFLGGQTTQNFALALIIGVFFGTYSSIFVAGPLLSYWAGRVRK
ncbi:MAG: protein translocase subunit SecF [Parcubacteria group bacterium]|nr:protein translocase subunit SecF [Parcubacteria group bacterium]